MHLICTAARKDAVFLAYLVAMPHHSVLMHRTALEERLRRLPDVIIIGALLAILLVAIVPSFERLHSPK